MHCVLDALVTATTADVAGHRFTHLIMRWLRVLFEKGHRLHDLPRLAVSALRHVDLTPGLLDRVVASRVKALDRDDLAIRDIRDRRDAGTNRIVVDHDRAGTAERLATTEFRSGQADLIAEKPQQRQRRIAVPIVLLAVYF